MADIARIIEVVEPEAKALGFDLVRVRYFKGGEIGPLSDAEEYTLQIMAERPETGQLVIEDCAALSHRMEVDHGFTQLLEILFEPGTAPPLVPV